MSSEVCGKNCWHCGIANCLYWCRDDCYGM